MNLNFDDFVQALDTQLPICKNTNSEIAQMNQFLPNRAMIVFAPTLPKKKTKQNKKGMEANL